MLRKSLDDENHVRLEWNWLGIVLNNSMRNCLLVLSTCVDFLETILLVIYVRKVQHAGRWGNISYSYKF